MISELIKLPNCALNNTLYIQILLSLSINYNAQKHLKYLILIPSVVIRYFNNTYCLLFTL